MAKIFHLLILAFFVVYTGSTNAPSSSPSTPPTMAPSSSSPTVSPTFAPSSSEPSYAPTESPSREPTAAPSSSAPSSSPTSAPSSSSPTSTPTLSPTNAPTSSPSNSPTESPSSMPTRVPTSSSPSSSPTNSPVSSAPTSSPTNSPTNSPSSSPTNSPVSSAPTSSPTNSPTNSPSSSPTNSPVSSAPTSSPTSSAPSSTPTSPPTSSPTLQPTQGVAEHIYVHAVDTHGDGWGEGLVLAVHHHHVDRRLTSGGPDFYSLNCACKVVRIFSDSGDFSISMHRNTTEPGPHGNHVPFEWEALWSVGYSDGLSVEPLGIYGGVDTEVVVGSWEVVSLSHALNTDPNVPKDKCIPPPPPKPAPSSTHSAANDTLIADNESKKPPALANVRLALKDSEGDAWCDDSGDSHEFECSKERVLSPDATLPNLLTYPRYFISDAEGRVLIEQGTMRVGAVEDVREVKMPREGSFVFSVSGHYLSDNGTLSWDFCGEQGGIGERLYFNMEHGVCKSNHVSKHNATTCDAEFFVASFTSPVMQLSASEPLASLRVGLRVVGFAMSAVAVIALYIAVKRRAPVAGRFARLDTTEHAVLHGSHSHVDDI